MMRLAAEPASPSSSPSSHASVLIIDDDPSLSRALTASLELRGYEVRSVTCGADALEAAAAQEPDVIILDLGLPDIDGLEVCRHLRLWCRAPILVLSADGSEDRKVRALDLGADDYLTKPFSTPELLARLRVAERHRRLIDAVADDGVLEVGILRIDLQAHDSKLGGVPLELAPKEYALLVLLARNAGRVLTHRVILDQVWERAQSLDTLRSHVRLLRRRLGEGPGVPQILTEPGVGYRLMAP
jgi:two-component system KDP operon response regulator KdpE